jgi:hypothetical protein
MIKGIMTIRCRRNISRLLAEIMVRNPGKTLYLHWVDYHKRFWTLDYDLIFRIAKKHGIRESIAEDIYFIRAFSRDNNEVPENWKNLFAFRCDLIILDSISEFYDEEGSKPMTYAIGKLSQLCTKNNCTAIVIDRSRKLHTYLAHVSSVIIELDDEVRLLKHPSMADIRVPADGQYRLSYFL